MAVPIPLVNATEVPHTKVPLRVLMLTHSVYVRDVRVRRYAEYLAREGHRVDIICLEAEDRADQSRHPNIRVYPLPMARSRKQKIGLVFNWAFSAAMMFGSTTRLDRKFRYDLVHVHNMPDFLVFCAALPRLRGCPIILNIHDAVPELGRSKLKLPADHPLIRIQAVLENISIRFSSHVITSTDVFKNRLIARGAPPNKVTVIANAPDSQIFRPEPTLRDQRPHHDHFTLLYVGTVAFRYGLHVAVDALGQLRNQVPNVLLKVYTKILDEGKDLEDCIMRARELGVSDIFQLHAPVPLEDMPAIMRSADLGLYPAFSDCHMDHALSLKIPEMACMGLPIVATRLPVLEEIFGDDAIAFVPPGSPQALAEKIVELYHAPGTRERLAENARKKCEVLSWERQYTKYREIVESLVGRSL